MVADIARNSGAESKAHTPGACGTRKRELLDGLAR